MSLGTRVRTGWELLSGASIGPDWWAEWGALADAGFNSQPALCALMAMLLVRCFGRSDLVFATLRDGGDACAKLLLQRASFGRWRIFAPPQAVVAPVVFQRDEALPDSALRSLIGRLGLTAWKLDFAKQDARDSWVAQTAPAPSLVTTQWSSVTIAAPEGFDAYWAARPRDLRDNVARRLRKADRDGLRLEDRVHSDPAAITQAIARYCELEARGWKGDAGSSLRPDADDGIFYRELLTQAAAEGRGSVHELWGQGRLLASRFVLRSGHTHAVLKTTYDETANAYSVGSLQLHRMAQRICADPAATIELCTHANKLQTQWATSLPPMRNVSVFRSSAMQRLFEARWQHRAHKEEAVS